MITLADKEFNLNFKKYEENIKNIDLMKLTCKCKVKGNFYKHGYYKRKVDNKEINILRVKCKSCGCTHAILPSFIIPYLTISTLEVIEIIIQDNPNTADDTTRRYLEIFKKWKNKLRASSINIKQILFNIKNKTDNYLEQLSKLIRTCSDNFKQCFMQNHRGYYLYIY